MTSSTKDAEFVMHLGEIEKRDLLTKQILLIVYLLSINILLQHF